MKSFLGEDAPSPSTKDRLWGIYLKHPSLKSGIHPDKEDIHKTRQTFIVNKVPTDIYDGRESAFRVGETASEQA